MIRRVCKAARANRFYAPLPSAKKAPKGKILPRGCVRADHGRAARLADKRIVSLRAFSFGGLGIQLRAKNSAMPDQACTHGAIAADVTASDYIGV